MKNESPIILQHKQRERHLLNVRQQYSRKKAVKVSSVLSLTCLWSSVSRGGEYSVAELDLLLLYI